MSCLPIALRDTHTQSSGNVLLGHGLSRPAIPKANKQQLLTRKLGKSLPYPNVRRRAESTQTLQKWAESLSPPTPGTGSP